MSSGASPAGKEARISEVTGTRIVDLHHPQVTKVMPKLMSANSAGDLLQVFEDECKELGSREAFGWHTAKEVLQRIEKRVTKAPPHRRDFDGSDPRFAALAALFETALAQGVMGSRTRTGYQSDDLRAVKTALETLKQRESSVYAAVVAKIAEETEHFDEAEPGDAGDDFQGGSVGF